MAIKIFKRKMKHIPATTMMVHDPRKRIAAIIKAKASEKTS